MQLADLQKYKNVFRFVKTGKIPFVRIGLLFTLHQKNDIMSKPIDLSELYRLRNDFTIIGLTGRTASGVSKVAKFIQAGFSTSDDLPDPTGIKIPHNSYRKYRIVYNYAKENFFEYRLIKYRDILVLLILNFEFEEFIAFLKSDRLKKKFAETKLLVGCDFSEEIKNLETLKNDFHKLKSELNQIDLNDSKNDENLKRIHNLYFSDDFQNFSEKFNDLLQEKSKIKRNKTLQVLANNLRKTGHPFEPGETKPNKIFTIVETINIIVKSHRISCHDCPTQIVIDSLRNPFEIMFFRQRYSAFYIMSINRKDEKRSENVRKVYAKEVGDAMKLFEEEYKGGADHQFYKQNVKDCIQQADIHINYIDLAEVNELNKKLSENKDNATPFFTWKMQIIKYISLISHPGLIPPSPEERCMQMAYTSKYNSGCISRQVGAAITDENYSIKAVGWNNTPEGQVPCVLRNVEDLIDVFTNNSLDAKPHIYDENVFTPYEKNDPEFRSVLLSNFQHQIEDNRPQLKGRSVCFCFKSLKNSCSEGKNQVHTRSLHAEESAFLQITKYGGEGILGGKLFSTASPCELCSKKAYQLGIKVIYYIDPYPGISQTQILEAGNIGRNPVLRLFNGAIGNAYHWLYEPLMAYKDELSLLLGQDIKDLTTKQKQEIADLKRENEELKARLSSQIANVQQ